MYEITVPKLNSNDASYVLTEWRYADGDTVPPGAEVAVVETSKAAEGLICEEGGVLQHRIARAQECQPGEVIGRLFPDKGQQRRFLAADAVPQPTTSGPADPVITDPARQLIDRYGVDVTALVATGKKVIGRADVERLLGAPAAAPARRIHRLSRGQLSVAEVVTTSHRTIPAAYAAVTVVVDQAVEALQAYSERERVPARLPELMIRCVADLFERFPLFFATALDDGTAALADEARVGVTIDVGRGLYVPVVGGAAIASLRTVTAALAAFRAKALREQLTVADLAGATIGISLPAGDVLFTQPLVPPGLACILALGSTQPVPWLDPDGVRVERHVAYLGLSYDHRLINGREAALFLGEIKAAVESPARLRTLIR